MLEIRCIFFSNENDQPQEPFSKACIWFSIHQYFFKTDQVSFFLKYIHLNDKNKNISFQSLQPINLNKT